ncbi:MAG TPA: HlyD family efflux transporter periplasmic adaptor subunit [Candidatus Ventrousia excrementavium]|uniref:HlyD family efflux transporter periplasmic adaptor subunit n=1 Tax=Candidatus Ventrousia excrementavium TaxID=2840961 RepID=A0A9D1LL55_9CLOT|nr:HlyD family efflux transporter periplasmic adaptor subunit [Candidatus Ventrousia excrementavium]
MQTQQTTPETRQEPSTPAPETPIFELGSKKRKKRRRIIAIAVVVVLAALLIVPRLAGGGPANTPQSSYVLDTVSRRDITVVVSGSAALEPADSYVVNALVGGEILSADFEEGDVVEKGALLYQIDTGDVENSIERSRLSVERAQMSYDQALDGRDDLVIEANESGVILELMVEEGDSISMGQTIASIRDSATMTLRLPFPSDDAQSFTIGQAATVTLDSTFETLNGTVTEIAPVDEVLAGNVMVRNVTIEVQNPGGIAPQSMASAMVGTAACTQSAAFEYQAETTVTASAAGTVDALLVQEGDSVVKNQAILRLESDSLDDSIRSAELSLRDAQLSLQSTIDQLDNYSITSPIAGTIVEKNYKQGDKLDNSSALSDSLCTIFDLSYLTLTLNVDELDVAKIEVGQEVAVTAEAVEGQSYRGVVTKVNINGTTMGGVTSYPVTVRIDETDGLLPGMNVDVEIEVQSETGVLAVPVSAVERGNRVLVKTGETVEGAGTTLDENGLPVGYEYREVTLGINDDDYIQITGGLEEGDEIAYAAYQGNSLLEQMMNGMMGGMPTSDAPPAQLVEGGR